MRVTEKNKKVICILGMHRSGTSMVMRLLNICGLYIGDSDGLLDGGKSNPKGHWEHKEILLINREILKIFEGSWCNIPQFPKNWQDDSRLDELYGKAQEFIDKMNSKSDVWGFKEPRTCLTLPFWQKLLPDMEYVIQIRSPKEVALSLFKRNSIEFYRALFLWDVYMINIFRYTHGKKRWFTFYEKYFNNTYVELENVVQFLHIDNVAVDGNESNIKEFIDNELYHNKDEGIFNLMDVNTSINTACDDAINALLADVNDHFTEISKVTQESVFQRESELQDILEQNVHRKQVIKKMNNVIVNKNRKIIERDQVIANKNKKMEAFNNLIIIQREKEKIYINKIQEKDRYIKMMQESKFLILRNKYIHIKNSIKKYVKK